MEGNERTNERKMMNAKLDNVTVCARLAHSWFTRANLGLENVNERAIEPNSCPSAIFINKRNANSVMICNRIPFSTTSVAIEVFGFFYSS
jgi:hypothetical protein